MKSEIDAEGMPLPEMEIATDSQIKGLIISEIMDEHILKVNVVC